MKVLILDGSKQDEKTLETTHRVIKDELKECHDEAASIILREVEISPCTGCFSCWVKTPGICTINDSIADISRRAFQSDLLIFITPIVFGGFSTEIKKVLDRWISIVLPFFKLDAGEVHHLKRYKIHPALLFIGMLNDNDEEKKGIFKQLAKRTAINSGAPTYACKVIFQKDQESVIRKIVREGLAEIKR